MDNDNGDNTSRSYHSNSSTLINITIIVIHLTDCFSSKLWYLVCAVVSMNGGAEKWEALFPSLGWKEHMHQAFAL